MRWGFAAGELAAAPDLAQALEPAAKAFTAWEPTCEGPWATAEGLEAVRAVLPSFRFALTLHASFREVDLALPDPAARERCVEVVAAQLEAARSLGASAVVVHPGRRFPRLADPRAEERCRASLQALARKGRDLGVEVRVENMPLGPVELGQRPEALRDLAESTTGAACWDAGHGHTLGDPDLQAVAPLVREVHLHDNRGTNDDHWPIQATSNWIVPMLRAFEHPDLLVTVEHRTLADCLASRAAAEALLHGR